VVAHPAAAQFPSCSDQFTWASAFVAENYAGFDDKVNARTRAAAPDRALRI
jgi:hypothetical protein